MHQKQEASFVQDEHHTEQIKCKIWSQKCTCPKPADVQIRRVLNSLSDDARWHVSIKGDKTDLQLSVAKNSRHCCRSQCWCEIQNLNSRSVQVWIQTQIQVSWAKSTVLYQIWKVTNLWSSNRHFRFGALEQTQWSNYFQHIFLYKALQSS